MVGAIEWSRYGATADPTLDPVQWATNMRETFSQLYDTDYLLKAPRHYVPVFVLHMFCKPGQSKAWNGLEMERKKAILQLIAAQRKMTSSCPSWQMVSKENLLTEDDSFLIFDTKSKRFDKLHWAECFQYEDAYQKYFDSFTFQDLSNDNWTFRKFELLQTVDKQITAGLCTTVWKVYDLISNKHAQSLETITLKRSDIWELRKSIFLTTFLRNRHRNTHMIAGQNMDEAREKRKKFMNDQSLSHPRDLWLHNAATMLETPHHQIGQSSKIFDFDREDYRANARERFVVFWEAGRDDEFILTDNSFGAFEGCLLGSKHGMKINMKPSDYAKRLYTRDFMWHQLFVLSPKLVMALCHGTLIHQGLIRDQRSRYGLHPSILEKLPHPLPTNYYKDLHIGECRFLKSGWDVPEEIEDLFGKQADRSRYVTGLDTKASNNVEFKVSTLSAAQVALVNMVLLQNQSNQTTVDSIVYRNPAAIYRALDEYEKQDWTGYTDHEQNSYRSFKKKILNQFNKSTTDNKLSPLVSPTLSATKDPVNEVIRAQDKSEKAVDKVKVEDKEPIIQADLKIENKISKPPSTAKEIKSEKSDGTKTPVTKEAPAKPKKEESANPFLESSSESESESESDADSDSDDNEENDNAELTLEDDVTSEDSSDSSQYDSATSDGESDAEGTERLPQAKDLLDFEKNKTKRFAAGNSLDKKDSSDDDTAKIHSDQERKGRRALFEREIHERSKSERGLDQIERPKAVSSQSEERPRQARSQSRPQLKSSKTDVSDRKSELQREKERLRQDKREKEAYERFEREREKERIDKEKERLAIEKERLEQHKLERERLERLAIEKERQELERAKRDFAREKEELARTQLQREAITRLEKEKELAIVAKLKSEKEALLLEKYAFMEKEKKREKARHKEQRAYDKREYEREMNEKREASRLKLERDLEAEKIKRQRNKEEMRRKDSRYGRPDTSDISDELDFRDRINGRKLLMDHSPQSEPAAAGQLMPYGLDMTPPSSNHSHIEHHLDGRPYDSLSSQSPPSPQMPYDYPPSPPRRAETQPNMKSYGQSRRISQMILPNFDSPPSSGYPSYPSSPLDSPRGFDLAPYQPHKEKARKDKVRRFEPPSPLPPLDNMPQLKAYREIMLGGHEDDNHVYTPTTRNGEHRRTWDDNHHDSPYAEHIPDHAMVPYERPERRRADMSNQLVRRKTSLDGMKPKVRRAGHKRQDSRY